jgi:hypothetical protein
MTRRDVVVEDASEEWFLRQPHLAIGVAAALYVAVFALRLSVSRAEEAITLLFVLPIALLAFAFGRRAGVIAGGVGVVLAATWVFVDHVELRVLGWLAFSVPLILLGALVGDASDRQRRVAEVERQLLVAELRAREAAEINDSIIQGLAAAKWSVESGSYQRGLEVLTDTIVTAEALVDGLLHDRSIRSADLHRREPPERVQR